MSKAFLIAGLAYGDEGKGITTAALAQYHCNSKALGIRYNGGPQAAHNVITKNGVHLCFQQFSSVMFIPESRTYLSRFMLVDPVLMIPEAQALEAAGIPEPMRRMFVDGRCIVITPFQRALNRLTEMSRGDDRHGSVGLGVGQAREDHLAHGDAVLTVRDLKNPGLARDKLEWHRALAKRKAKELKVPATTSAWRELGVLESSSIVTWYVERYTQWISLVTLSDTLPVAPEYWGAFFEGAQGMLLDETHGFQPHTTWTDITFRNAETLIRESDAKFWDIVKIGVLRAYFTRHGAGPFDTEDPKMAKELPEAHNTSQEYAGSFRIGHFDMDLAKYSRDRIGGVNRLSLTHLDRFCNREVSYNKLGEMHSVRIDQFTKELCDLLQAKLIATGHGPKVDQYILMHH